MLVTFLRHRKRDVCVFLPVPFCSVTITKKFFFREARLQMKTGRDKRGEGFVREGGNNDERDDKTKKNNGKEAWKSESTKCELNNVNEQCSFLATLFMKWCQTLFCRKMSKNKSQGIEWLFLSAQQNWVGHRLSHSAPQSSSPGNLPGFIYMSGYAGYPAHKLQMGYLPVFRCITRSAW